MKSPLDPSDFVISRKRKKYKFAKFHNSTICYELDEWQVQPIDVIEIGAGTGLFSVELAKLYPEMEFLAIDVKADRLQKGAYQAMDMKLNNIKFLRARADQLDRVVEKGTLSSFWITFPDPFPKKRSAGRRLTHDNFLDLYSRLLKPEGCLYLKHDNPDFFAWSLERLVAKGWSIDELSFDLHESKLNDDYKIMTTYEQRWLSEGRITQFVKASHD